MKRKYQGIVGLPGERILIAYPSQTHLKDIRTAPSFGEARRYAKRMGRGIEFNF